MFNVKKKTEGAEGRNDVTLKSGNCCHLCNEAHLHALSSVQRLELPKRATPARAAIQEELACWINAQPSGLHYS